MEEHKYMQPHLSAYLRGRIMQGPDPKLHRELTEKQLADLTEEEMQVLIDYGTAQGIKLYHFKSKEDLPRVRAVLGALRSIQPKELLDVGSGRGVFLYPFMRDFPFVPVTSVDLLPKHIETLQYMRLGGMENITMSAVADICTLSEPAESYDAVTMLEVLEHIPNAEAAVRNAVRMARRFVIISVPSHPDDNPEHIHLFTKDMLAEMFTSAGCKKLNFSGVNGHTILIAGKQENK